MKRNRLQLHTATCMTHTLFIWRIRHYGTQHIVTNPPEVHEVYSIMFREMGQQLSLEGRLKPSRNPWKLSEVLAMFCPLTLKVFWLCK